MATKSAKKKVSKKTGSEQKKKKTVTAKKTTTKKATLKTKTKKKSTKKKIAKPVVVQKPQPKVIKKKVIPAKKLNLAHSLNETVVHQEKPATKESKKAEQSSGIMKHKNFILVLFGAVVIMNAWVFLTTPVYAPSIVEQQITNPVFDSQATYFKLNIPESEWNNFDGKKVVEQLVAAGVKFDEAIYQQGGRSCDVCPSSASPLLFLKNPSYLFDNQWAQVAKPGFYENSDRYLIYQYLLQY